MSMIPENQTPYWINRLSFLLRRNLQGRFSAVGIKISPEEWAVLLLLWNKDKQTPGDLAHRTIKDQTTMTRLLDAMERKGLVDRKPDDQDRRKSRIALTGLGCEMRHKLVPIAAGLIADSQSDISAQDLATTRRVLQQMTKNLLEKGD